MFGVLCLGLVALDSVLVSHQDFALIFDFYYKLADEWTESNAESDVKSPGLATFSLPKHLINFLQDEYLDDNHPDKLFAAKKKVKRGKSKPETTVSNSIIARQSTPAQDNKAYYLMFFNEYVNKDAFNLH